jgi:putative nucleotidyltransferase-like protein
VTTVTRQQLASARGRYRPEEQLLVECVGRSLGTADLGSLTRLVSSPLDWPYLLQIATWHQILPLLQRALVESEAAGATPPAAAAASIRDELDRWITRNRRLALELARLLRLADQERLALLPFKGPLLALAIYGDLALRQFADLDLLVEPSQSEAAEAFLDRLGYEPRNDIGWAVHLVHRETGLCVDLHRGRLTRPTFPVPISVARLWARRQRVWLDDTPVDTLSTEDLLVLLCVQIARDAWRGRTRLAKVADLAHVLQVGPRLQWSRVEAEAAVLHVRGVIDFAIRLAERITRVSVPFPLPPAPNPGIVGLVDQEERALFDDPDSPPGSRVRYHLFHLHLRERWRDKLRPYHARVLVFLSPNHLDRATVRLPPALGWLHYLLRPFLVLRRHGAYLIRGRLD